MLLEEINDITTTTIINVKAVLTELQPVETIVIFAMRIAIARIGVKNVYPGIVETFMIIMRSAVAAGIGVIAEKEIITTHAKTIMRTVVAGNAMKVEALEIEMKSTVF